MQGSWRLFQGTCEEKFDGDSLCLHGEVTRVKRVDQTLKGECCVPRCVPIRMVVGWVFYYYCLQGIGNGNEVKKEVRKTGQAVKSGVETCLL